MMDESEQSASSAGNTSSSNTEGAGAGLGDMDDVGATVSKPEGGKTSLPSKDVATSSSTSKVKAGTGPGDADVGTIGIVLLALYLIAAILLCFYGLIALWPRTSPSQLGQVPPSKTGVTPTPSASRPSDSMASVAVSTPTPTPSAALSSDSPTETSSVASPPVSTPAPTVITIFGQQFQIWDEVRLLLMVILAGALGSLVHTVRSVYWYVGNRQLKWSWVVKYILQPFAGGALAMIFYVVVRGGFFSPQTTVQNTSPFGFAALAALVGLFSEQAVLKLKKVAETVLEPPAPGADATPQDEDSSTSIGRQKKPAAVEPTSEKKA
jgi:hypothetical protein